MCDKHNLSLCDCESADEVSDGRRHSYCCAYNSEERHDLYVTKYYQGNQIKEDGMGRVCGMFGGKDKYIEGFDGET